MGPHRLKENYLQVSPQAERLRSALVDQLNHLLFKENISLGVPIESRVKNWSSIEEKLERKDLSLICVEDLDDLIGMRLILLFRRDLAFIGKLLSENLNILSSEDKSAQLSETQFGYQSQHFIVKLPKQWLNVPTWRDLGDLRVEIQVRTLAQHIWAAVSHKLQYKHEASVPPPLRRSIHRASALLETVDIEFDRLLEAREAYVEQVIIQNDPEKPLNVDILESILTKILPAQNKKPNEPYDQLISDLHFFGVHTAGQLEDLLVRHYDAILKSDAAQAKTNKRDEGFYFQHIGLVRQGLRKEFGEDEVKDYLIEQMKEKHDKS